MRQIAVFIALGAILWFGFSYLLQYAENPSVVVDATNPDLTIDGQRVSQVFRFANAQVLDGDSVRVTGDSVEPFDVRLAAIDAPEWSQAFGQEAKQYLEQLLGRQEIIAWQTDTDRYGRVIAFLFIQQPDGQLQEINVQMIRAGYAWHFNKYSSNPLLGSIEYEARANRVGLWNTNQPPVPPWEFRASQNSSFQ